MITLESLRGMTGAPVLVLALVWLAAYAIAVPLRKLIHRFTPHEIDAARFDDDEE